MPKVEISKDRKQLLTLKIIGENKVPRIFAPVSTPSSLANLWALSSGLEELPFVTVTSKALQSQFVTVTSKALQSQFVTVIVC